MHFSNLFLNNYYRPEVLFLVINAVLNVAVNNSPNPSNALSESLLSFFVDKIANLRPQAISSYNDPSVSTQPLASWGFFGSHFATIPN